MSKCTHSSYFLQSILKRLSNHIYFRYPRENRFRSHLSTTMTGIKKKNWMWRSILNFCFWTKNWSIDHALSDKSTKRGGTKCRSAQEEWGGGKERRDWSGVVGELSWGRALQLSAIFFNVGYVLATSLRKEAGNTTLECCFSLNMDAVNVDFVRDLAVTQGKTRSLSNGASISHTSPWSQPFPE